MKIEITNKFIKDLEKALKKEVPFADYCDILEINVALFDKVCYDITISWGYERDNKKHNHTANLFFNETDSVDFIRGQFARVVEKVDITGKVIL